MNADAKASTTTQIQAADQTDVLAQNEQLTTELKAAKDGLTQAASTIEAIRAENTELKTKLDTATKGSTTLQTCLTEKTNENNALKAENTELKTKMTDFNKSVATEVSKAGIRTQAAAATSTSSDKKLTATEKVLAAKGIATLDDLKALTK